MSKTKKQVFNWKMLTSLEKQIIRAFDLVDGAAMNAQQIYLVTCIIAAEDLQNKKVGSVIVDPSEIEKLKTVTASESRAKFAEFGAKHPNAKLPSYPTVKKYLMRFAANGWLEQRVFSAKKKIIVYRVSDEVKEALTG